MPPEDERESVTNQTEEGAIPDPAEEQDDALWNEVASERESPPADDAAEPEPDPAEEEEQAPAPSGPGGSDKDSGAAVSQGDPPASQASDDDIWAGVAPEAKARLEKLFQDKDHQLSSVKGRLSVLDRQLEQFRGGGQGQRQGGGARGKAKLREILESDDFKKEREEYGDQLPTLFKALDELTTTVETIDGTVQTVEDQRTEDFLLSQLEAFAQVHPDWESFANDDRFDPWLRAQPRHVQEAAARNSQFIVDGGEASDVLARFKAAHGIGAAPPPPPPPPPPGDKGSSRDERRDRQRQGARGTTFRGGSPVTMTDPEDEDAQWDAIVSKRERQRQAQR